MRIINKAEDWLLSQRSRADIPGLLSILLGLTVMFGWLFQMPLMTTWLPEWKPMVPGTALGFLIGGWLCLFGIGRPASYHKTTRDLLSLALLLLVTGKFLGPSLLGGAVASSHGGAVWRWFYENQGQMSLPTALGFLTFLIGKQVLRRSSWNTGTKWAKFAAALLLGSGSVALIAYAIKLPYLFESQFISTGLIWFSIPTALGMVFLGSGLWFGATGVAGAHKPKLEPSVEHSLKIYRIVVIVIVGATVAISIIGIHYLEDATVRQAKVSMEQTIQSKDSHLKDLISGYVQRSLLVSSDTDLISNLFNEVKSNTFVASQNPLVDRLKDLGFTAAKVETQHEYWLLFGQMQPESARRVKLKGEGGSYLIWNGGYFLETRIPLSQVLPGHEEGQLLLTQSMPYLSKVISDANDWGQTGTLPMCARINADRLLCYPQREQPDIYEIPDSIDGQWIPMAHALAGEQGVRVLVDYRGRHVLAAFGPVGLSGLGLVLKMDLTEVYAPVRHELGILVPLIVMLTLISLGLIRLRVRPLLQSLTEAHLGERAARAQFEAAMESSPDIFVIYDAVRDEDGRVIDFRSGYVNTNARKVYRAGKASLDEHSCVELFPMQKGLIQSYRTVLDTGEPLINECSWTDEAGNTFWYQRQVVAMPEGVATTFRDVTEEKKILHQLEFSNQLRTAIVESAAYAIISTDLSGQVVSFNKAAERMLWYRADEIIGKYTLDVFHDREELKERAISLSHELARPVSPGVDALIAKAEISTQEDHEWTYVRKDGSKYPVRVSITALRDEQGRVQGFLSIAYDISEQKRAEEYIRHIALHDVLTGLPNRALLDDRLTVAIDQNRRNGTPFAVAMMDIDRFKHINDSMGHHIGDKIIKEFVDRVRSCLRLTDTLARMGGDEFVLLLADTDEIGAERVVSRIKKALVAPIDTGLQEIHVTSSVGVSLCPDHGQELNELLRCADVAMYWVKEHGRNGYKIFSKNMDHGLTERLNLERELHLAIENNGFEIFYQPKMDLHDRSIVGFEALLRMKGRDENYVSPAEFIPLAEETGLIVPIGKWVLNQACQDAVRLQSKFGSKLSMAVNVSPRQFVNADLVEQVKEALDKAHLEPSLLDIEITEGVLVDEREGVDATLRALRDLGVQIAIDDFGTGYSSLSYLRRYPISQIKIDQSFVHDITSDKDDAALIEAIITMAESLNMPVVAEGIETNEQLALLANKNCGQGQGYLISRPMPLGQVFEWLKDRQPAAV